MSPLGDADCRCGNFSEESLLPLLRRDWAMRALDAWAGEHGDYARSWENCRKRGSDWVLLTDGGPHMIPGQSPDSARHAAALAVFPTLPDAARAELGECP